MNQFVTKEARAVRMSQADQLLIQIILKNTKVTQEQIDQSLAECQTAKAENRDLDLAHAILAHNWLSRAELYKLGRRMFRKGFITKTQLDEGLAFQRQLFKALGDIKRIESILMDDGHITPDQVREIWAEYTSFLKRKGDAPVEPKTDPSLMKRGS